MNKTLVVYYSHSGNTKKLAGKIAELTGADLLELVPEQAYPQDYNTVVEQAKREIQTGFYPKLKNKLPELAQYDVILAGTPNWWSTMAPPVGSFLKDCNLRHTYITNLIHASVDSKTVQYLAGHESSKITMDIYAKVKYNRPDELVRSMSCAFASWEAAQES